MSVKCSRENTLFYPFLSIPQKFDTPDDRLTLDMLGYVFIVQCMFGLVLKISTFSSILL